LAVFTTRCRREQPYRSDREQPGSEEGAHGVISVARIL
jgi:hypothetical protein